MTRRGSAPVLIACLACGVLAPALLAIQSAPMPFQSGQGVTPSFEGWYRNLDGSISLSFGYMNRNYQETLDIPIGPNNRIEPGAPDQGQPTHFLTRRHTGIFTVVVPRDFPVSAQITWTITANGQTNAIPGHVRPEWEIDALKEATSGNTPPLLKLAAASPGGRGPNGPRHSLSARVGQALSLPAWVSDDDVRKPQDRGGAGLGLRWSKYRGAGPVSFGSITPKIEGGQATTTATFAQPGDYVLRALVWDASGPQAAVMAGGFQCCWTNGYVTVAVTP